MECYYELWKKNLYIYKVGGLTSQKRFSRTFPANPTERQSLKDSSTWRSAEKQDSFNHLPQHNKPLRGNPNTRQSSGHVDLIW
jgi:hypothetical protein